MDDLISSIIIPEYYYQNYHHNFFNQIIHSQLFKMINPLRTQNEVSLYGKRSMPLFFGQIPHTKWQYLSLDYSFDKHNPFNPNDNEMHMDKRNKFLGHLNGGTEDVFGRVPVYLNLQHYSIPRGCLREITKYTKCREQNSKEECFQEKVNIMEICPLHILENLRHKKRNELRAQKIDNNTYRRAMEISKYNKGRTVSDLEIKNWFYSYTLRPDSYWADDRYDPKKYPHLNRNDNVNFPEQKAETLFGSYSLSQKKDKKTK